MSGRLAAFSPWVRLRLRFRTTLSGRSPSGRPLPPTTVDPSSPPWATAFSITTSRTYERRAITANRSPDRFDNTLVLLQMSGCPELGSKHAPSPLRGHLPRWSRTTRRSPTTAAARHCVRTPLTCGVSHTPAYQQSELFLPALPPSSPRECKAAVDARVGRGRLRRVCASPSSSTAVSEHRRQRPLRYSALRGRWRSTLITASTDFHELFTRQRGSRLHKPDSTCAKIDVNYPIRVDRGL
jgi:hypothetical protein